MDLTNSQKASGTIFYMKPRQAACKLCNIWFTYYGNTWRSRFRALYRNQDGMEIKLSEVAVLEDGDECLLLDTENGEWNAGSLSLVNGKQYKSVGHKDPYMCCYLFHELCWDRVLDHFCPDELDLASLHKALFHFSLKRQTYTNGFYRIARGEVDEPSYIHAHQDNDFEPFLPIPNVKQIMRRRVPIPSFINCNDHTKDSNRRPANKTDVFAALPAEVRQIIAVNLVTRDFLALRSASRSMVPLLKSATFWKSRFFISGEFGYLYHTIREFTRVKTNGDIDWCGLFIRMKVLESTPQLSFQTCLWDSLGQLKSATRAFRSGTAEVSRCGHYHTYPKSCVKNTHKEVITFGQDLRVSSISTSLVKIGYEAYISGLVFEFYQQRRFPVAVGHFLPGGIYRSPFKRCAQGGSNYSYHPEYPGHVVHFRHLKEFHGFSFCKDDNGIHSLAVIDRNHRRPRRVASCLQNKTDKRTDLILDKVTEVIVTLDHCKVVDLEIRDTDDQEQESSFDEEI